MSAFTDAKALYERLPEDHPLKEKYGVNFSKDDWKDFGKNYSKMGQALIQADFDAQMAEIEDREALTKEAMDSVNKLLDASPEYKTAELVNGVIRDIPMIASRIKKEYVDAGNNIENIAEEKLKSISDEVISGLADEAGISKEYADKAKEIYGSGAKEVREYTKKGIEDVRTNAKAALDTVLGDKKETLDIFSDAASDMRKYGEKSMKAEEAGISGSEDIYGDVASRSSLPGEGQFKRDIGANVAGAVRNVKDVAPDSASALLGVSGAYESGQKNLRELAITRADFLLNAKKDLAEAKLTAGEKRGSSYREYGKTLKDAATLEGEARERMTNTVSTAQRNYASDLGYAAELGIKGAESETDLLGTGNDKYYKALVDSSRYGLETRRDLGMEMLKIDVDVKERAATLRAMGYEKEANMLIENAELASLENEKSYKYNELNPYLNKLNVGLSRESRLDPFSEKMDLYGDITGMDYAFIQSDVNKQQANKQGFLNLVGSIFNMGQKKKEEAGQLAMGIL